MAGGRKTGDMIYEAWAVDIRRRLWAARPARTIRRPQYSWRYGLDRCARLVRQALTCCGDIVAASRGTIKKKW